MKNTDQLVFRIDIQGDDLVTSVSERMTRCGPVWSANVMAKVVIQLSEMFDMPPDDLYTFIGESLISYGIDRRSGAADADVLPRFVKKSN